MNSSMNLPHRLYEHGPYSAYLQEKYVLGSSSAMLFRAEQPAGSYPDPAFPNALLYVCLNGSREATFDWGAGRWNGHWRVGDLTLVPPGSASDVTLSERHSFLAFCLPDISGQCAALYAAPFRDELLVLLCRTLWQEADSVVRDGELFLDHAVRCVSSRLEQLGPRNFSQRQKPTFSGRLIATIRDYIESNCEGKILVADLATIAECGASQFSEMFHGTTGMSPYSYVLAVRLERARQFVRGDTARSLSDIAIATGFSSQSHLTSAYRRTFGKTLGQDRRRTTGPD